MTEQSATFDVSNLPASGLYDVPVSLLRESGLNHRKQINKTKFDELVASIREQGVIQSLVLRPVRADGAVTGYEVIAGNRRWKAALEAKRETVPGAIRELTDEQAAEIILIENIQREDVHPLEEAEGYTVLSRVYQDIEQLAARVGKKPSYVKLRLQLNNLVDKAKKAFWKGEIQLEHALEIARLTPEQQEPTLKECTGTWRGLMTLRELREYIQRQFHLKLAQACFSTEDAGLIAEAGPCTTCQKRTGANTLLFPDVKEQDTCTDPKCFTAKVEAHILNTKEMWLADHPGQPLVELSTAYGKPAKGVLARDEFEVVKGAAAKAPGVRTGIIVNGEGLGKLVTFTEPKRGTAAAAALPMSERKASLEQKNKDLETRQHNEEDMVAVPHLMKAVAALQRDSKKIRQPLSKDTPLTLDEMHLVAREVVRSMSHDTLKRYCDGIFGKCGVEKSQYGSRDYSSAAEKRLKESVKDLPGLGLFLLELLLFKHIGHDREGGVRHGYAIDPNPIYVIANNRGVSFDEVFAPIQERYGVRRNRAAKRLGLDAPEEVKPESKKSAPAKKAADKKPDKTTDTGKVKQPPKPKRRK